MHRPGEPRLPNSDDKWRAAEKACGGLCRACHCSKLRLSKAGICRACNARGIERVGLPPPAAPILATEWRCEACQTPVALGQIRCHQHTLGNQFPPRNGQTRRSALSW